MLLTFRGRYYQLSGYLSHYNKKYYAHMNLENTEISIIIEEEENASDDN